VSALPAPASPGGGRPVAALEGVDVHLGGRQILDRVSFSVGPGTFTGMIGSNGAGKTTIFRVLLGLQRTAAGRVLLDGAPRSRRTSSIGYVPQKVVVDPDLPLRARDLVALGVDGHRFGLRSRRGRTELVDELLEAVGARAFADARVGRLSGGELQRVLVAHALAGSPRLLVLDEPLANLDLGSEQEIVALLARLCAARGVAVLISAHDVNPLLPVMDQIVYVAGGRAASGTVDEVVRSDVLSGLYGHPIRVLRVEGRVLVVAADPTGGNRSDEEAGTVPTTIRALRPGVRSRR
jgi:zinc/manganese transport system ATP-binding protein